MIINLISGPRNVSTALMYSFAQRSDTLVSDEPFYAVYLSKTGLLHPGASEVLQALPRDEELVKARLSAIRERPVLFIKNMAHHMEVLEEPFIEGAKNIFLIRDPRQILVSYSAVIKRPLMRDIGVAWQYTLFSRLLAKGIKPVVVDSAMLLQDPPKILSQLCRRCGLDYEQRMEHWPEGPKSYDGVWAPYWYRNAHRSTGFEKPASASRTLVPELEDLCREARSFYEKLLPFSLKA